MADNQLRKRVAWAMWKRQAERTAPKSQIERRTFEAFQDDLDVDEYRRWIALADAAVDEIARQI